jgi:hypothetical protein
MLNLAAFGYVGLRIAYNSLYLSGKTKGTSSSMTASLTVDLGEGWGRSAVWLTAKSVKSSILLTSSDDGSSAVLGYVYVKSALTIM